jgi:hypothetical protein
VGSYAKDLHSLQALSHSRRAFHPSESIPVPSWETVAAMLANNTPSSHVDTHRVLSCGKGFWSDRVPWENCKRVDILAVNFTERFLSSRSIQSSGETYYNAGSS